MLRKAIGHRLWAVPDGYIPGQSNGPAEMVSHETVSVLNTGDQDAHLEITLYFGDRDPAGPYRQTVPARRTRHIRLNTLEGPGPLPPATDYSYIVESDVPVVVQHARVDSRQAENALGLVMAFPIP